MPVIIDYDSVLDRMRAEGFRSLYYNSGAFGFSPGETAYAIGWIGPPDASIRPEVLRLARPVLEPYEPTLASLATRAWQTLLPGPAWVMPKSHWAYELDFGSADWMPAALSELGADPAGLKPLTNAAALQFEPSEAAACETFVRRLLARLKSSDFMLAFPGRRTLCTVHHHKQLWWQTADPAVHDGLNGLL